LRIIKIFHSINNFNNQQIKYLQENNVVLLLAIKEKEERG